MSDIAITSILIFSLFAILASGVWIGLTLSGVAWIAMQLFSSRAAGDAMAVTIWGSSSSWTLTAHAEAFHVVRVHRLQCFHQDFRIWRRCTCAPQPLNQNGGFEIALEAVERRFTAL